MKKNTNIINFDIKASLKEKIKMCLIHRIVNSKDIDYYLKLWEEKGLSYIIEYCEIKEIPNKVKNTYNKYLISSNLLPEHFLECDSYPKEEPEGTFSLRVQGYFKYDESLYKEIDNDQKYKSFWDNSLLMPNGIKIIAWWIPLTEEQYIECKKLYKY